MCNNLCALPEVFVPQLYSGLLQEVGLIYWTQHPSFCTCSQNVPEKTFVFVAIHELGKHQKWGLAEYFAVTLTNASRVTVSPEPTCKS